MRYINGETGNEDPNFVLNKAPYRKAAILITGPNFGCGSSREHAPWAILDLGIKCLIGVSFAEIFFNNCMKNGMLPIKLPQEAVDVLMADAEAMQELTVDLDTQLITRASGEKIPFPVDGFRRHCLMNGLDDIGLTMQKDAEIAAFEVERSRKFPWLDGPGYGNYCGAAVRLQADSKGDAKEVSW